MLTSRKLVVEGLENRAMLAGNVNVSVSGGTLFITGDGAGNGVSVQQLDTGRYFVSGIATGGGATSINGQAQGRIVTGVTNDINVDLNAGDDIFIMTQDANRRLDYGGQFGFAPIAPSPEVANPNTTETMQTRVPRNLIINTDEGNDGVGVSAEVGRTNFGGVAHIITGTQNDRVNTDDTQAFDDLLIETGDGDDQVHAYRARTNDFFFANLGAGKDSLDVSNFVGYHAQFLGGDGRDGMQVVQASVNQELLINSGIGDDTVKSDSITANQITVITSDGLDSVLLKNARSRGNLLVDTGANSDTVEIDNAVVANQLAVYLGSGNDRLSVAGNSSGDTHFDGGADFDTYDDNGGNSFGSPTKINFEQNV